jgi:hypothetical protein
MMSIGEETYKCPKCESLDSVCEVTGTMNPGKNDDKMQKMWFKILSG